MVGPEAMRYRVNVCTPKCTFVKLTGPSGLISSRGADTASATIELFAQQPRPLVVVNSLEVAPSVRRPGASEDSDVADEVDPATQFVSGGRQRTDLVPAGSTTLPGGTVVLNTGTVAGTIKLLARVFEESDQFPGYFVDVTEQPAIDWGVQVERVPPEIVSLELTNCDGQECVVAEGFSTTLEVAAASVTFESADETVLASSAQARALAEEFFAWYSQKESIAFGSLFHLEIPVTASDGASVRDRVRSLTMTLSNSQGTSAPVRWP